jgi:hypothetical protein
VRCRTCDHALWRTVGRTCPECGTAFSPAEFRFRPSTVAFRCPHCAQDYYGTDANGLLEPREFGCVKCGNHVRLDEMVLEPAAGRTEQDTISRPNAWAERDRTGLWKAWWRSTVAILFRPLEFGDSLPPTAGAGTAFRYLLLCAIPTLGIGVTIGALLLLPTGGLGGVTTVAGPQLLMGAALFLGLLAFAYLGGAIGHGTLALLGGTREPLSRSVGCSLFAHGATSLLGLVPCINCIPFLGAIWWFSSFRLMLAGVHGCGRGKATLAALVPLLLMASVSVAAVAVPFLITAGITPGTIARAQGGALASMHLERLADSMRQFEIDHGRPCDTPIELLVERPELALSLAYLIDPDGPGEVTIEGRSLMPELARAGKAGPVHDALLARRPAGPHRLGNLVVVPPGHPRAGQFGIRDPVVGDLWVTIGTAESPATDTAIGFPPGIDFDTLPDLRDP